jgi:hypothetical protein
MSLGLSMITNIPPEKMSIASNFNGNNDIFIGITEKLTMESGIKE